MGPGTHERDVRYAAAAVTGVVLAGGRSTRFEGGDKALAEIDGEPMLARVVDAVSAVTDAVVVNCRDDQRDPFADALETVSAEPRFAIDDRPDDGPLVGLDTALRDVETPLVVVASCDLPALEPEVLGEMLAEIAGEMAGDAVRPEAVVPIDDHDESNPACAAYRTEPLAAAVARAVDDGDRSLKAALDHLRVSSVDVAALDVQPAVLADVDTRADLESFGGSPARE